jgi:hypothetical protein
MGALRLSILPHISVRRVVGLALSSLLLLLTTGVFVYRYCSFEGRFRRSKAALEGYAAVVMAADRTKPPPPPPQHLGAFQTGNVEWLPHGFLFYADYGHPLDANGIAFSTEPLPQIVDDRYFFTPIGGNWYKVWRN